MSRKPHRRSKRCFYGRPSIIPSGTPDRNPEWTRRASVGLQIKCEIVSSSHTRVQCLHLPLSTISVSVALCSTRRIFPNHPSPTIWRISNSSIRCTYVGLRIVRLNQFKASRTWNRNSRVHRQTFTFSNSNSRILCMWRFERLEPDDSLLDDDDEWLDDAIAIVWILLRLFSFLLCQYCGESTIDGRLFLSLCMSCIRSLRY